MKVSPNDTEILAQDAADLLHINCHLGYPLVSTFAVYKPALDQCTGLRKRTALQLDQASLKGSFDAHPLEDYSSEELYL